MLAKNPIDLIGNTPMVPVHSLNPNPKVRFYLKLEKYNPGGSVKDRIAKYMIEDAEQRGLLTKDKVVLEPTSGNTGIGLAMVCGIKGYRLVLVMPESMTKERRQTLIAYGAHLILTPAQEGMDGAEDEAHRIVNENPDKYFMPNQFANEANVRAHRETTAEEIWRDTKGTITHFVAGLGTSGTIMGIALALKPRKKNLQLICVEADPKTPIPGLKNLTTQYVPKIFRKELIDERTYVRLEEAQEAARLLALREGVFVGPSSGAIFLRARQLAQSLKSGTIVALMPDGGERYLSTQQCDIGKCSECAQRYGIECILTSLRSSH
ncbi:MAG: PLP-dependent cysteine synthase family protein [Promethearchaeota archaeon]